MVSERSLARICRPAVLGRGRLIAAAGGQIVERVCRYDAALTRLSARVLSVTGEGSYRVDADVDEAGDLLAAYRCTCPAAARFPGPCKHVVAVALDFNRSPDAYDGWDEFEHVSTTPDVAGYLDRLVTTSPAVHAPTDDDGLRGEVRLDPIVAHDFDVALRLRIAGRHGSYVVRDVDGLCALVAAGSWHSYGKNLSFVHRPEAFDAWSRELIAFVGRCVQNRHAYALESRYGYRFGLGVAPGAANRELRLSDPEIDELLELCDGRALDYEYHDDETGDKRRVRARVTSGDPAVRLTVRPVGDDAFELVRDGAVDFFATASHAYAFQSGTLYRCGPAFVGAADFMTDVYCSPEPALLLSSDDAARFAALSLPVLEAAMPVDVPPELGRLRPVGCRLEFYLDRANDVVVCDVQAVYGERRHHVLAREVGDGIDYTRDLRLETRARALVGRYLPVIERGRATLSERDADAVATLLFDGVPEMRRLGTVFASDSFGRLTSGARPRVSIGLSVRSNLLDLSVSSEDLPADELHALLSRYRRRKRYYRLRDGSYLDLAGLDLDRASLIVDELGLGAADLAAGRVTLPSYKAFLLDSLLGQDERDDAFERYVSDFRSVDPATYDPPESLARRLRPYQLDGFRWLSALVDMGFGGILADEMGLGKSVQLIALLLARRGQGQTLVVCPASLVYNWRAEFAKFAPAMDVAVVAGTAAERRRIREEPGHEVLVTSYDLLRRDVEDYVARRFWCVALDEAQYVKNHETLAARAVKSLDAGHRLALTGTPVENRLAELWSIFDFLMPGLLGTYDRFRERYEQPVVDGDEEVARRLRDAIDPFVMRRRKADVLDDLPEKLEQTVVAQMGPVQRRLYAAHEQELRETLRGQADASFRSERMQVLAALMRLRQLCCDPRLVYEDYDGESCKLDAIVELVESAISSQQKVLVFSQFTSYLSLVADELAARGIGFYTITGATPKRRRVELVDAFNADGTPAFLVSLKAGGTGLNLTGASVVVHADPWWNAAAQDQATDRAHRIGQTRDVTVYKVIAKDTIEERIVLLQEAKSDLVEQIIGTGGATSLATLTRSDLIELLGDES